MAELTVLFDGSCNLCRDSAERARRFDKAQRIEFLELHDPAAQQRFPQVNREEAVRRVQAVDSNRRLLRGSDDWLPNGTLLHDWKFAGGILLIPGTRSIARWIYGW